MNQFDELNSQAVKSLYFVGFKNQLIRIYYYLQEGLKLLNDFKYLLAGILAFAVILKVEHSFKWMGIMFAIAVPVLTVAGYVWTHQAKKSIEYFNLKYTTHFSQYGIRLQERHVELLQELNDNLKKLNKTT